MGILDRFKMKKIEDDMDVVLECSEKIGECEGFEVWLSEDNYVILKKGEEYWLSSEWFDDEEVLNYIK